MDTQNTNSRMETSRTSPFKIDARARETESDSDNQLVSEKGIAENLGILTLCGEEKGLEAQQAQHDVIGATYLRMLGFVKVSHLIEACTRENALCFGKRLCRNYLRFQANLNISGGIMSNGGITF